MLHYCRAIEHIGPPRKYWSMTFEAKHKFFKTNAHSCCNFKNISKSLAYRHQLARCFSLLGKTFTLVDFEISHYEFVKVSQSKMSLIIMQRFSLSESDVFKRTDKIFCNGCEYRVGCFVLLSYCSENPTFGCINEIVLEDDECNFIVTEVQGDYDSHFAGYALELAGQYKIIDLHSISHYLPMYKMQSFQSLNDKEYIAIPFKYI